MKINVPKTLNISHFYDSSTSEEKVYRSYPDENGDLEVDLPPVFFRTLIRGPHGASYEACNSQAMHQLGQFNLPPIR